jgi:hypothetical protein
MNTLTTRQQAKLAGCKRYEGKPCVTCNKTARYVRNMDCVFCRNKLKNAAAKRKRNNSTLGRPKVLKYASPEEKIKAQQEYQKQYRLKYKMDDSKKGILRAKKARRRCAQLNRTPKWLTTQDKKAIKDIYDEAVAKTIATGILYHVDHIIPLQGKLVSGLHVPSNLQVITAKDNLKKLASYEVD